jgi:hypothetical protein
MSLVWQLELPDSEKIVLLALADCANDEGHCWPGMPSLVRKCSKTDRTIQASIKKLCDAGHLTRREVPGKGCNYTVHPRSGFAPEVASPRSDCAQPPKSVRDTPEATSGKPSKNHQEPPSKAQPRPCLLKGIGLPEIIPAEPWAAFVRMRKAIPKVPFTEDAARGQIRKVEKLAGEGYDPAKLLWKAVDQGWRSPFPHDDCKATSVGKRDAAWHIDRAEFFDKIGKPDDAAEHRKRAMSIGQLASEIARSAA